MGRQKNFRKLEAARIDLWKAPKDLRWHSFIPHRLSQATILVLQKLRHFLTQGLRNVVLLQVASQQTKFRVPQHRPRLPRSELKVMSCSPLRRELTN